MNNNIYNKVRRFDQKIVIFDSPDGTGKTNIAQALSSQINVPYFRMDSQHDNWRKGRFKDALEFDQTYISSFLRQTKTNVIIDRAWPSEWVYSKVYNRETNNELLEKIDDEFASMGAYVVIPLRRDYSNSRPDEVVKPEELKPLHDKYVEFCEWTRCSTIQIYVDDFHNNLNKQLPLLVNELDFNRIHVDNSWFATNVILQRPFEKKDISSLFQSEPVGGKSVNIKSTRKPR